MQFADLHDTPVRMKDKAVIKEIIPWAEARRSLYWRLRRRLLENDLKTEIVAKQVKVKDGQASEMLRRWFIEDQGENNRFQWDQDKAIIEWLAKQADKAQRSSVVQENMKVLERESKLSQFKAMLDENPDLVTEIGLAMATKMTLEKRSEFVETLSKMVEDTPSSSSKAGETSNDDSSENGET